MSLIIIIGWIGQFRRRSIVWIKFSLECLKKFYQRVFALDYFLKKF